MMFNSIDTIEKFRFTKAKLLSDPLFFTRFFFKYQQDKRFIIGDHHLIIADKIKKIYKGEITKLIINMPPRYGKTELLVKTLIGQGLALNPKAKFIHTSYSDSLALDNSEAVRDLILSDEYQYFFPLTVKADSKSKKKWYTAEGGGVYATSCAGQITGFGAGIMEEDNEAIDEFVSDIELMEGFGGAFIIDDPIKPEDSESMVIREGINLRFDTTFRSRVNSRKTPFIIVMQRVHSDDLTGYLLKNEPGEWDVLSLPALKDDGEPLWPFKHTKDELNKLSTINPRVFYYQYQQQDIEIQTGGEYLSSFDPKIHIKKIEPDISIPICVSIDNNVHPYIAVNIIQLVKNGNKWLIRQIHELPCKEPNNKAGKAGEITANWLKSIGYKQTIKLYGDRSTKNKNTIDEESRSFATLFTNSLIKAGFNVENKMLNSAPSPSAIGEFLNAILQGELEFGVIEINETCIVSRKDYLETKKDKDGSILKKVIYDPILDVSYQEHGHFVDTLKDFIVAAFNSEFLQYKSGPQTFDYTVGKNRLKQSY